MYTTMRSPLFRLRAYRRELEQLYAGAIRRRDLEEARRLHERRRSVQRAILVREEWAEVSLADSDLDEILEAILHGSQS